MIKKLQQRFVFIAMLSFTIVLFIVAATINLTIRGRNTRNADGTLDFLAENREELPIIQQEVREGPLRLLPFASDKPVEVRYFTVSFDKRGEIIQTDTQYTFLVNNHQAEEYGEQILHMGNERGYFKNYRYLLQSTPEGTLLIGLDCVRQRDTEQVIFSYSLLIVAVSLLVVFGLLIFFSKRLTSPISRNLEHQKQFISDAGHEIKTPLTIISANNDIIKLNYGKSQWTQSIDNQVQRMNVLVSQLLQLSRLDHPPQERTIQSVDVAASLQSIIDDFQLLFQQADVTLSFLQEPLTVQGYPLALDNLFHILLDNMVRYTPAGGIARVTIQASKQRILFENTLDSPLEEEPSRLFDRFYRRESSRSREMGGNGIGLSIAGMTAKRHKATLTASSKGDILQFELQF